MGWGSGAEVMSSVIGAVKADMSKKARKKLYKKLIPTFQGMDWDTEMDCLGEDDAFDEVLEELHPEWFEDEDWEDDVAYD